MATRAKTVTVAPVAESETPATGVADPTPAPGPAPQDAGVTLPPTDDGLQAPQTPAVSGEVIDLHPQGAADPLAGLTRPKRGRGRPPGSKTRRVNIDPDAPQIDTAGTVQAKVDYRATAEFAVRTITGLCSGLIGPEWQPTQAEDKALCDSTETYFRAKGIPDIPPGWMLFICVMGYATPRLNAPSTKEKLARVINRVKNFGKRTS